MEKTKEQELLDSILHHEDLDKVKSIIAERPDLLRWVNLHMCAVYLELSIQIQDDLTAEEIAKITLSF